ncbi:PfkB family carbohydrate kinase [Citreimonas salinaria]|uniref:Mannose or cellobiose epimerase, N-acyl-D-glucosamine 2-epimerase family n=1 Tax=Citreimonas salinaria TaxID=321339 RepID=A0A1H3F7W7_9RHOB|nr:PfkB family carbohydrate kinase [Citreimonas salinaria]SDX87086.1 Mannose or cellobiose epimerase, N-acyl-D-glucosamine 2-epimerase family [Citreimonas salinaria]
MSRLVAIGEVMIELSGGIDDHWRSGVAGDTFNTLWYARLGLDPARDEVAYFTALGTDSQSDRIVGTLSRAGIGTSTIRRIEGCLPGLYMIEKRDGDRAFLYWRGQSAARALADDRPSLSQALHGADMIYLSGITLAILSPPARQRLLDALDAAREAGAIIAFDPNIRPALWNDADEIRHVLTDMAAHADIVLPSFEDEMRVFGDASPADTIARYLKAGAGEVAVKNAERPVTLSSHEEVAVIAARSIVDATGAGDSFNGGYIAARLKGQPPVEAARAGIAIAEKVIAAPGAIHDLPGTERWCDDSPASGVQAASRFATARIPAWLALALPPGGEGPTPVLEALGESGPRTTLTQCRVAFTLAHLHTATGRADLLAAAERVHGFVAAHLRDADGGYRFSVAPDGTALEDPASHLRRSYDQSFALLALAALFRTGSSQVTEADLEALWTFVDTQLVDPETGALWEDDRGAEGSEIRAQNPQMHMLEALLEAHAATGREVWLDRARPIVRVAREHLIDSSTGAVREFVGSDLKPLDGPLGARREPGHQFEWAWLLRRYGAAARDKAAAADARRMVEFAEARGMRHEGPLTGAPYDAVDAAGHVTEATHLLWPLTEAGKVYAQMSLNEGDAAAAAKARRIAGTIFGRYFAPMDTPRWVNRLDGDGRVVWDTALSRLLYHVALFVTEGGRAGLWRLDGSDSLPRNEQGGIPPHFTKEEKT